MNEWRAVHVHTSEVNRLILDCVHPFLEAWEPRLDKRFWERHYAGGPHLRIRLHGPAAEVEKAGAELATRAGAFLARHPSPALESYSEPQAARLMEWEETPAGPGTDLRYRNNAVERHPYPPPTDVYVSREAALLMEDFRHDALLLATRLLASARPKREALLRIYFLHALEVGGELPAGSVSFKSHWEGFASSFKVQEVIDRVRSAYLENREPVGRLLADVADLHAAGRIGEDPDLAEWRRLVAIYDHRAHQAILAGAHLTRQASNPEEGARQRRRAESFSLRESEFLGALRADDRFLASIQYEPSFLVPRTLVNLLYSLVAAVGLKPIDKFALCHFAFRAVEERSGRDLTAILKHTISELVARNAPRWGAAGSVR
jgi:hypothetical protein